MCIRVHSMVIDFVGGWCVVYYDYLFTKLHGIQCTHHLAQGSEIELPI